LANIFEALKGLHKLGIFHGDASIFNCIITTENRCIFFDLEGAILDSDSYQHKAAYEYLHLADTSIKFLPKEYKKIEFWTKIFSKYIYPEIKGIDITIFKKKFHRLNNIDPGFKQLQKSLDNLSRR
jgi:tRNA A-37 threonylcarbamoyl transferase component Bud32